MNKTLAQSILATVGSSLHLAQATGIDRGRLDLIVGDFVTPTWLERRLIARACDASVADLFTQAEHVEGWS
jgi:hypothetical protein